MTAAAERASVISGIGQSDIGRRLGRSGMSLTLEACLAAIDDAGLTREDINGVTAWPGPMPGMEAFSGPGAVDIIDALRLEVGWYGSGAEGAAQFAGVVDACAAVALGLARHVLCFRTVTESTGQGAGGRQGLDAMLGAGGVGGQYQWSLPFHAYSAANWLAIYAQRHMHEFGTTREQLAAIALNGRANAARNPAAIYRAPLSLEEYLDARMITTPFCLYDCDVPVDGSTAVIVSHVDYAPDAPGVSARVEAIGSGLRGRPSWDQWDDVTTMACRDAAAMMWDRTDLRPTDVDVAELYDGFSFLTLAWLEALGFCGKGEAGPFIEGGSRISIGGALPLNTHGGQLSAGRLHGFGFLYEAVVQLRGDGGARQAGPVELAVAAAGGGPLAGCLLLSRC